MSLIKPGGNGGGADAALRAAEKHYRRALAAFEKTTDRVEAGVHTLPPETERVLRQFGSATNILFKEKQKIEDSIKKDAGIVHDFAIDFESAREEIRRRMACLRAAADAERISE